MRNDPMLRLAPPHRSATDGWLGTREFPGYRAGSVVARLDDLPGVDRDHLYFDLLLLDAGGRTQDNLSGPCYALARQQSLDERSRFVRMVAELVRHAPSHDQGLTAIGQALSFIRERGIEIDRLITAAQLLDNVCSESSVAESLNHMLELSLGDEEARRAMCDVVAGLARGGGLGPHAAASALAADVSLDTGGVSAINGSGLAVQVSYVVRTVGKNHARRYLREATFFELVPKPDMFGV